MDHFCHLHCILLCFEATSNLKFNLAKSQLVGPLKISMNWLVFWNVGWQVYHYGVGVWKNIWKGRRIYSRLNRIEVGDRSRIKF